MPLKLLYGHHFFIDPIPLELKVDDSHSKTAYLNWRHSLSIDQDVKQTYTLTVISSSTQPMSFQLQELYFTFTAPEGAPPCEVYNFSVTATYVGATYTGAGCSIPSPVLSRMLPSLPDIDRLESSLEYSLIFNRQYTRLTLTVSFEVSFALCTRGNSCSLFIHQTAS